MSKETYTVIRAHIGDKPYEVGDTRDAVPSDVAHLIGKTLAKKAPEMKNKVAPKSQNKAFGE